jgi:hypothetical protein
MLYPIELRAHRQARCSDRCRKDRAPYSLSQIQTRLLSLAGKGCSSSASNQPYFDRQCSGGSMPLTLEILGRIHLRQAFASEA